LSTVTLYSLLTRPPTSTPFPYTTLFRSKFLGPPTTSRTLLNTSRSASLCCSVSDTPAVPPSLRAYWYRFPTPIDQWNSFLFRLEDRKSTRLNSSHVKISYAVFCLKKKKK